MKAKILYLFLLASVYAAAQVGIGTTDPKAILDIKATNQASPSSTDGMLVPKIDTFPATNPGVDQQGMLVYLTTTIGINLPGFYYWNNPTTTWVPIGNNSNSGWSLNGNTGTDDTVNFIGTTDNEDIVFKRNNIVSGKIDDISTSFGINTLVNNASNGFENSAFGLNSLQFNTVGKENSAFGDRSLTGNTIGESNSAFGRRTLFANTTGNNNSAFGKSSLNNNTTGSFNSSFGSFALLNATSSFNNSAFGYQSQMNTTIGQSNSSFGQLSLSNNTTGGFNTAIGRQVFTTNTTGDFNTGLGALANVGVNNLTNATAIGARAQVDSSNSMVLGSINGVNGATANVNVGIGTTTPQDRLHVVGNIRMVDGNEAVGKVLTSDANGTASWQNASASAWGLNGNSGPGIGFLGTTDDQNVIFRRNNVFNGGLGIANLSLGDNSRTIGNGADNTAIGIDALRTNTGQNNTALGRNALGNNPTGSGNVAVGRSAMVLGIGSENTAVGHDAFQSMSGNQSSAFGAFASATPTSLNNATAIGARAQVAASNSMVLGSINGVNGATADVNVGIGTTTPQDKLHVVGNIRMVDGNEAVGKVMVSDANGTASWTNTTSVSSGTLDQAYDFGGAGNGKTITADTGAVLIDGTDGLVSTGTVGFGVLAPTGLGPMMYWNPRKAAFRAGITFANEWENNNTGLRSTAFGTNTMARGTGSMAFGEATLADGELSTSFGKNNLASGILATAFGTLTTASGNMATAFGTSTVASNFETTAFGAGTSATGLQATAFGALTIASGSRSTAFGSQNTAFSFNETVMGIGATTYTPSANGATQFRTANETDRLFVIGNAIDANNNGSVDVAERSDAMVVLKNGNTGIGSSTPQDKLHVVGNIRMVDGNEAAGRIMVSNANGTASWTNTASVSSGTLDQAYDFGGAGNGNTITADSGAVLINGTDGLVSTGTIGVGAIMPSGIGRRMVWNPRKTAFRAGRVNSTQWDDVNVGVISVAFGDNTTASGSSSSAFGSSSIASGSSSTAFGSNTTANGTFSTAFGLFTTAFGFVSTTFGSQTTGNGNFSTAFGHDNTASSLGETVIGIGATTYTPSANGNTQFRAANATDRLFVIGNAIDSNNNGAVGASERSDAMVVLKNGNTGIGTSLPARRLHVFNGASGGTSNANTGILLESNQNVYQHLLSPSTNEKGLLFGSESASIQGGIIFNNTNATNGLIFRTGGNNDRVTITSTGSVGILTTTPSQRLEVAVGNIEVTQGDIFLGLANGVFNAGGGLMTGTINYIGDSFAPPVVVNGDEDLYIEGNLELGGNGFKPGGGVWVAPSDRRLKQNIQPYTDGLESLLRINPVSYKYNSTYKTLDTGETYIGVIAQEVQEIAPYMVDEKPFGQLVEEDENGHEIIVQPGTPYLTFDSSALTYMLINSVKEINEDKEQLKRENSILKQELESQKAIMQTIIQRLEAIENR